MDWIDEGHRRCGAEIAIALNPNLLMMYKIRNPVLSGLASQQTNPQIGGPRPGDQGQPKGRDSSRSTNTRTPHQDRRSLNRGIHVTQINLHRSKIASATLAKRMEEHGTFVVLVQEPWTRESKICGKIPNANLYVGNPPGKRPRACVYTSKDIKAWKLTEFSDEDTVTIQVYNTVNEQTKLVISSTYMAAEGPVPPTPVEALVHSCNANRARLIVGGDANSHHTLWGSTNTNDRGEALLDFIWSADLVWCNSGNQPTFKTRAREEVLDITLVNHTAQHLVQGWKVDQAESGSDHAYIEFRIEGTKLQEAKFRNVKQTNWPLYRKTLQEELGDAAHRLDTASIDDLEGAVERAESSILKAFHQSCPEKKVKVKPHLTWWTPGLTQLRDRIHHVHVGAKRTDSATKWEELKCLKHSYAREIRRAKAASWKSYAESIESQPPLSRIWKALRTDASCQVTSVRKEGRLTTTPHETLQCLLDHHVPADEVYGDDSREGDGEGGIPLETGKEIVTDLNLHNGLWAFDPFKSPGADGIYPKMLQEGWGILGPIYKQIYITCLCRGYVPKSWRRSRAVFIPKPGKATYEEVKSYRMISLTSFQLKLLERLVFRWLSSDPRLHRSMNARQFGFRAGVSTDTALHTLIHKIERAQEHREFALGVFLDIENAFPTLKFSAIEQALAEHGIEGGMIRWIGALLRGRTTTATLADAVVTKEVTRGCPQGGILSPFLWNITMDQLLHELQGKRLYVQAYADDIAGLMVGIDPATLIANAQKMVNICVGWGERCGLRFSKSKSEAVMFTTRRRWTPPAKNLKIEGSRIELSPRAKYLGITIDAKLTFNDHVDSQVKKATAVMAQAKRLAGKTWGLTPKMTKWIYTAMVLPVVTYACLSWLNGAQTARNQQKLTKMQRRACMLITSAYPGTPTAALEVLSGLLPMDLILTEEAILASTRLEKAGAWTRVKTHIGPGRTRSHTDICNAHRGRINSIQLPVDQIVPIHTPNPRYSVILEERQLAVESEMGIPHTDLKCFTDGSKMEGGEAGAGVVVFSGAQLEGGYSLYLGRSATVYQAEVVAIATAAQHLHSKGTRGETIHFLSDSRATLLSLKAPKIVRKTVSECVNNLNRLAARDNTILVRWIPGHTGVDGNEEADKRAKEGARTQTMGPEPFLPVAQAEVKHEVHQWALDEHRARWTQREDCRQAHEAMGWPSRGTVAKLTALGRADLRLATQAITGHCNLNRHRSLQRKAQDPLCPKCLEHEETPEHLVGRCLFFEKERLKWLGRKTTTIRQTLNEGNVGRMVSLLKKTGRFSEF